MWKEVRVPLVSGKRKSTKINFLSPETTLWGGGLPRERVGVEKLAPSLESSFPHSATQDNRLCLVCCRVLFRDVRTPGGVQKAYAKRKSYAHSLAPIVWLLWVCVCGTGHRSGGKLCPLLDPWLPGTSPVERGFATLLLLAGVCKNVSHASSSIHAVAKWRGSKQTQVICLFPEDDESNLILVARLSERLGSCPGSAIKDESQALSWGHELLAKSQ